MRLMREVQLAACWGWARPQELWSTQQRLRLRWCLLLLSDPFQTAKQAPTPLLLLRLRARLCCWRRRAGSNPSVDQAAKVLQWYCKDLPGMQCSA